MYSIRSWTADQIQTFPNPLSFKPGGIIGGIIRLAFHDAIEYDPDYFSTDGGLRSDGCVNLQNPLNAGLTEHINRWTNLWLPYCRLISRADFWVFAANTAISTSNPYILGPGQFLGPQATGEQGFGSRKRSLEEESAKHRSLLLGQALHSYYILPFNYGRMDRLSCTYDWAKHQRVPDPEGGAEQIETFIMKKYGLNSRQAVALLGAHAIGHANMTTTGYNSSWKDRADLWDTQYFKAMVLFSWKRVAMRDPVTGKRIWQFNNDFGAGKAAAGGKNLNAFMLNTDLALIYNVSGNLNTSHPFPFAGQSCGAIPFTTSIAYAPPPPAGQTLPASAMNPAPARPGPSTCPYQNTDQIAANFYNDVLFFALGNTNSQDEPGATRWMQVFAGAWTTLTQAGYATGSLTCAYFPNCIPSTCTDPAFCDYNHLCVIGAVDNTTSPSPFVPGATAPPKAIKALGAPGKIFDIKAICAGYVGGALNVSYNYANLSGTAVGLMLYSGPNLVATLSKMWVASKRSWTGLLSPSLTTGGSQFRVMVLDPGNPTAYGYSPYFSIKAITVTYPTMSTTVTASSLRLVVSWNADGLSSRETVSFSLCPSSTPPSPCTQLSPASKNGQPMLSASNATLVLSPLLVTGKFTVVVTSSLPPIVSGTSARFSINGVVVKKPDNPSVSMGRKACAESLGAFFIIAWFSSFLLS